MDGQDLKLDGEAFKGKLNPDKTFDDWKKKVGVVCCRGNPSYHAV